jgi:hypothetical protein
MHADIPGGLKSKSRQSSHVLDASCSRCLDYSLESFLSYVFGGSRIVETTGGEHAQPSGETIREFGLGDRYGKRLLNIGAC